MEVNADDEYEYVTETVVLHIPTADTSKPGTDSKNAHGTSNTQSHSLMDQTSVSIRHKHDADGNFIEEEEVLVRYGSRVFRVEERKPIGTHLLFKLPPQSESNSEQERKASFVTKDLKHYYVTKEFVHKAANVASGTRTVVVKIGTSSIYNETTQHPNLSYLSILIETIVTLLSSTDPKFRVVLVSSGAVGLGMKTLGLTKKPKQLSKKQALAAVGQNKLMNLYDLLFSQFGTSIGQVLLTRNDIHERSKYLNACNTFNELLSMGIVPIVNENDTVSVAEIRFGDNDTLSAVTANMVKADILILLTDVECMYTDNPRTNPEAKAVYVVDNVFSDSLQQVNTQSGGSSLGTGGMVTKIVAAKLATSAGIEVVISSGKAPNKIPEIIRRVFSGENPSDDFKYTHFKALKEAIRDRKWWIQFGLKPTGCIVIDDGAFTAVSSKHAASLFAVGITSVEGNFSDQEVVSVKHNGEIVGQGIVNYSSDDMKKIVGIKGDKISEVLGFDDYDCVIHRDNLVIAKRKASTD